MRRTVRLCVLWVVSAVGCTSDRRDGNRETGREASAPLGGRTPKSCGVTGSTVLTGGGIGSLTIGAPLAEIRARCSVVRDTVVPGADAEDEHEVLVDLVRDTVAATLEENRVWRLAVERSGFRTADSLGVGSTLGALLRSPSARGVEGEGQLFVLRPDHCGLSFRIGYEVPDQSHKEEWTHQQLSALPDTARVDVVLVVGCSP
jgi:hypothetical protein